MQLPKYLTLVRSAKNAVTFQYRHPDYIAEHGAKATWKIPFGEEHPSFDKEFVKLTKNVSEKNAYYDSVKEKKSQVAAVISDREQEINICSFSEVAAIAVDHWIKENNLCRKTIGEQMRLMDLANSYLGDLKIAGIGLIKCQKYLDEIKNIKGDRVARRSRQQLINIFNYAQLRGYYPERDKNPAFHTENIVEPKGTKRPMTQEQFDAIYSHAPEWMQIAMDLSMLTSQRPYDIRNMKWSDIKNGVLTIVPHKVDGIHARGKADYRIAFAFDLSADKELAAVIRRAEILNKKLSLMRVSFRNCPYIVARVPEKSRAETKALPHPCYVSGSVFNNELQYVRDEVHSKTKVFWHDGIKPTMAELPSWYGIRKLSLQKLAEKYGEAAAQQRGGHTDISTTRNFYLGKMDHILIDATLPGVM